MLFLWTEGSKGRPVAAAQFFLVQDQWHHEFQSLSTDGFIARSAGEDARGWNWEPSRAGLTFVRADRIDPPADSANARLRQMKSIANRFTASVLDRDWHIRKPGPIAAVDHANLSLFGDHPRVPSTGALFAFVQGTNPEVLILNEAESTAFRTAASGATALSACRVSFLRAPRGPVGLECGSRAGSHAGPRLAR